MRDELTQMRKLLMSAAIKCDHRAIDVDLKNLTPEEKHSSLLLLLLQLKDGFVKSHVDKCRILHNIGSSSGPEYVLHATLLCRAAIGTWSSDALDKFLIGDLGMHNIFISITRNLRLLQVPAVPLNPTSNLCLTPRPTDSCLFQDRSIFKI
jgi:hypothetical protein